MLLFIRHGQCPRIDNAYESLNTDTFKNKLVGIDRLRGSRDHTDPNRNMRMANRRFSKQNIRNPNQTHYFETF